MWLECASVFLGHSENSLGMGSLFLLHESIGSSSGHWSQWQAPLPMEPFCWPIHLFFEAGSLSLTLELIDSAKLPSQHGL